MTLKNLVVKLESEGRPTRKSWVDDLTYSHIKIIREEAHNKLYGFVRGLYSAGYLTEEEKGMLSHELHGILHNRKNGGQP